MTDLPAGRELDALVAEKVMRWEITSPVDPNCEYAVGQNRDGSSALRNFGRAPGGREEPIPLFSANIAAAWLVVRRMREHPDPRKRNLQLVDYCYNRSYASFGADPYGPEWAEANGENATPHAICLAALAAHFATGNGEARIVEVEG